VNNGKGVTVYGSYGPNDKTPYGNKDGMVNVVEMSGHHDAQFISQQTKGQEENYLKSPQAASLFNVALGYHAEYPADSKLMFTAGTTENGTSARYVSGPRAGDLIHPGHNLSIDLAYMDSAGRPTGISHADWARTSSLIRLFDSSGMHYAITANPSRFGFGPVSVGFLADHTGHIHVQPQPKRIEPQIVPGRR
jgi:hypothetical protein